MPDEFEEFDLQPGAMEVPEDMPESVEGVFSTDGVMELYIPEEIGGVRIDSDLNFSMPGSGVVRLKGETLDLNELKTAAEDLLKEIALEVKEDFAAKMAPIVEWAKDLLSKHVPAIGKYYAEYVVGAKVFGSPINKDRIAHASKRAGVFVGRAKTALKSAMRASKLEFNKIAENKLWKIIEKVLPLFAQLSKAALSYFAPGIALT